MKIKNINIDIFHSITTDFIGIFLALFTSSFLAYKLSLEGRGIIAFIQSSIAFLGFLTTPITAKYEIFLGKNKSEIRNSFLNSSFEIFILCIFASILLIFLTINTINIQLLILSIINLWLIFFSQLYQRLLLAKRMIKQINYLNIISSLIYIFCLLLFNYLNQIDMISIMGSYIIMSTYLLISYLFIIYKLDKLIDLKIKKHKINFNFNNYIGVLFQEFIYILFERGPLIFISQRFGVESAALYRIASTFQDLALKLPRILNFVFRGFSLSAPGGWRRVIISANLINILSIVGGIFLFLFGDELIGLLFSDKYLGINNYAAILVFSVGPWSSMTFFLTQINIKYRYPKEATRVLLVIGIICVSINYLAFYGNNLSFPNENLKLLYFCILYLTFCWMMNLGIILLTLKKTKIKLTSLLTLKQNS